MFRLNRLKRMFGFAGWQLFGGVGNVLRAQGSAILVNLSFGARVNAAFSIANQVCAHSASLSASLQGALTPAVTTAEGAGRHDEAKDLSFRACKFSVLLVLLFAIPLISEIDYVLRWWLKTPPMFTSQFCIGMLIVLLIDKLTFGHMVAITAVGKIAGYQATLGTLLFITPFIGWIMINMGMDKIAVPLSYIITVTLCTVGRLVFCRRIVGMSIGYWFKFVFVRVTFVATIMFAIGVVVKLIMEESFLRLAVTTFTEDLALIFISYWFALDKKELNFIAQKVKGIFQRWRT